MTSESVLATVATEATTESPTMATPLYTRS